MDISLLQVVRKPQYRYRPFYSATLWLLEVDQIKVRRIVIRLEEGSQIITMPELAGKNISH